MRLDPGQDDLITVKRGKPLAKSRRRNARKIHLFQRLSIGQSLPDFFDRFAEAFGILLGQQNRDVQQIGGKNQKVYPRKHPLMLMHMRKKALLKIDEHKRAAAPVQQVRFHFKIPPRLILKHKEACRPQKHFRRE